MPSPGTSAAKLSQQSETLAGQMPENGVDSDRRGERRQGVFADSPNAACGHFLVVSECDGERDYEIEHPDGCPTSEWETGLENCPPVLCFDCAIGDLWSAVGTDDMPDVGLLAPGRYPVRVVTEHTPSLPTNWGEEWAAWIEVAA